MSTCGQCPARFDMVEEGKVGLCVCVEGAAPSPLLVAGMLQDMKLYPSHKSMSEHG